MPESSAKVPAIKPLRVVIADDSRAFREALRAFLASLPRVEVVGVVADGAAAVAAARTVAPDVVILDVVMPLLGGKDAARRIRCLPNAPRILLVSLLGESELRKIAIEAGADGFLNKGEIARRLPALLAAHGGGDGLGSGEEQRTF